MSNFLVAESGTPQDRRERRADTGESSGETYAATLRDLSPGAAIDLAQPSDEGAPRYTPGDIGRYDAVFVTGSPIHIYHRSAAAHRQVDFMRAVFASGVPSFGSCAGLQVAVAAAGGAVRQMARRMEAGISRRIVPTAEGARHPLLAGRPATWDSPALHGDEVERLPEGAILLAGNAATPVQAAEIRCDRGIFWGVQYHPELTPGELAAALRREAGALMEAGLAGDEAAVSAHADRFAALDAAPDSPAARWQLGVDDEFAHADRRRLELINFIAAIPDLDRRG